MKVCFVSPEVFNWGVHGGFGFITRMLSRELVNKGVEVQVVTRRRSGQRRDEYLDGVKIIGFDSYSNLFYPLNSIFSKYFSQECYRLARADIYHSQEVSYNTIVAQNACPNRKHIITFQDPYDEKEWERIARVDPRFKLTPVNKLRLVLERNALTKACEKADALYTQAFFLASKAKRWFRLRDDPQFLPNPVQIPELIYHKADVPTVCFLARWDPQKRGEIFFNLARDNPDIEFIAMGHSHSPKRDVSLRKAYGNIPT